MQRCGFVSGSRWAGAVAVRVPHSGVCSSPTPLWHTAGVSNARVPGSLESSWRKTVLWAGAPLIIGALNEFGLLVAAPAISDEFGIDVSTVGWMLLAFLIADALVLVAAGRLGDRIGRGRIAAFGLAVIALGSLICAVAPSFSVLLVGRVIEGLGIGVVFSGLLAIIADAVPPASRGRAFGIWALIGACAVLISPVAGGLLSEHVSWRWIFVLNVVISLIALGAARRYLPPSSPRQSRAHSQPSRLLASADYAAGTAVTALCYASMALTWLLLVFFLTVVAGFGLTTVGVMFIAYAVWWLVLPPFTGRFADRVGVRTPMIIGAAVGVVGFGILAIGAGSQSAPVIGFGLCALGIGVSFVMPASNAATMANVPADIRGDASGINMTVRILGSIIGLAVSTFLLDSIEVNDLTSSAQTAWVIALILMLVAMVVSAFGIRGVKAEPVLR